MPSLTPLSPTPTSHLSGDLPALPLEFTQSPLSLPWIPTRSPGVSLPPSLNPAISSQHSGFREQESPPFRIFLSVLHPAQRKSHGGLCVLHPPRPCLLCPDHTGPLLCSNHARYFLLRILAQAVLSAWNVLSLDTCVTHSFIFKSLFKCHLSMKPTLFKNCNPPPPLPWLYFFFFFAVILTTL